MGTGGAASSRPRPNRSAVIPLQHPRGLNQAREEPRGRSEIPAATDLRVDAGQEVVQMRSDKAGELEERALQSTHQERGGHHAHGNQLCRDGEEEEVGLLASCVLGRGVSHGEDERGEEEDLAEEVLC